MTLHEAIEKLLQQTRKPMTAREIANELNKNQWYVKADKSQIKTNQISARVDDHPELFLIDRSVSPHQIKLFKKMINQFINCPKCGTRNFSDDQICGICKTKLNPSKNKNQEINMSVIPQKTNYFVLLLITGGLIFFMYNIFHKDKPNDDTTVISKANSYQPLLPANSTKNYLLSSAQEFKNNFNSLCKRNGLDLYIGKMDIQNGEVNNSVKYIVNEQIEFAGALNKNDNTLIGVTMIGQGNSNISGSGADVLLAMLCLIGSIDPSLSADQRGNILNKLGVLDKDNDILDLSDNITINGIKYSINSSPQLGIMFGAEIP